MSGTRQAGFDNPRGSSNPPALLSAAEAVALLGVKRATLYSYASRGWVRSLPKPSGGGHLYAREDLLRLRQRHDARAGHGAAAAAALAFGAPILETALCRIGPGGPLYRGREAVALARGQTFETVCEWLWWEKPEPAAPWSTINVESLSALDLPTATPLGTLLATAGRLAALADAPADPRAAAQLLAVAAGLPFGKPKTSGRTHSVAALLAAALQRPTPPVTKALNAALIVCAEHELTASSFAARIAASTGANLWACLAAGFAAMSGPRHGTASEQVTAYVRALRSPGSTRAAVAESLRGKSAIPGFGHPLFPQGDPRAVALLALARAARPEAMRKFEALAAAVQNATGEHPTLDMGLAALVAALELPDGAAPAIFAVGRTAGLIGHILEQRADGRLLRPRAQYVGA